MPKGSWAFLQETVIYEYLMHRMEQKELRVRQIVHNGKPMLKSRWLKVALMESISNTFFPDIKALEIKGDKKGLRPAEVKFVTSFFNYHREKKYKDSYRLFMNQKGCIIVLKHDYVPSGIIDTYPVDVYELDYIDFISFAKENFVRFLNRQIRTHEFSKTWMMVQSKNFHAGNEIVLPASQSYRWCPTDNLTGFDLAVKDKVVFVRTQGASKQSVSKDWYTNKRVTEGWYLKDLWIGEVTTPIKSREEYCAEKNYEINAPLWYDETASGKTDSRVTKRTTANRWKRVFEFKPVISLFALNISLNKLYMGYPELVKAIVEIYTNKGSREISQALYTAVMEYIAEKENERKHSLINQNKELSERISQIEGELDNIYLNTVTEQNNEDQTTPH